MALPPDRKPGPDLAALTRGDVHGDLARVRSLAWLLDSAYLDPIIGFFLPGAGDLIGAAVGMYTIAVAIRLKVPAVVIARMLMNLTADAALGIVPVVGDVADVAFKANKKNLALITEHTESKRGTWKDWLLVLGAFALFAAVLVGVVWGTIRLFQAIL